LGTHHIPDQEAEHHPVEGLPYPASMQRSVLISDQDLREPIQASFKAQSASMHVQACSMVHAQACMHADDA
jgi:hypothetical protein